MAIPTKTIKKVEEGAEHTAFAVIANGGKQYRVSVGDVVTLEKMDDSHKKGDLVTFDKVLLTEDGTNTVIGTPYVTKATVSGEVALVGRAAKVMVIKYKQKSRYQKKNGHRQPFVKVKITAIA